MKMQRLQSAPFILLSILLVSGILFVGCGSGKSGPKPDNSEMGVTDYTPTDGAVDVPVNSAITATFNKSPKCSKIDAQTFILKDSSDNKVSGSVL